jgi:hypothetical protein
MKTGDFIGYRLSAIGYFRVSLPFGYATHRSMKMGLRPFFILHSQFSILR